MTVPQRQIRATFDADHVTVYQAFDPHITEPAVAANRFVPPFKMERMTWIKPSFLWMMYRCGWATKAGQARVLAIEISRDGFEWALRHSALSHPDPGEDITVWRQRLRESPVRVQWDPERDPHHNPLPHRSIQIGLSGPAVGHYVSEWIHRITDITDRVRDIHGTLRTGSPVSHLLPSERPYPLPDDLRWKIRASEA
ncbi:uncharacterized protein DUF4291 [Stackebrandtia endophytica]|uniref:Uncharacterized protein DUF4291 n=1 Tax=Stackebrandtia endophytica TaxID=1496996 RepID=A0A543ARA3_9ACTN|nr:DUF4291 domain-containing protein [Stackebrandtia endophytica]TQL75110.1 uncharacterized protein DUF4291 [Stackebrandtia endophytica]